MPAPDCVRGAAAMAAVQGQPSAGLPLDGALWRFAVALYGSPGVAQACLALQDRFELDVNLLLFAAWLGAERRLALPAAEAASARQRTAAWHGEIVRPLRRIRQRMKSGPAPAPSPETQSLRADLKAVELDAERIELALLERIGDELKPAALGGVEGGSPVGHNLRSMVAQCVPDGTDPEAERQIGLIERAALELSESRP